MAFNVDELGGASIAHRQAKGGGMNRLRVVLLSAVFVSGAVGIALATDHFKAEAADDSDDKKPCPCGTITGFVGDISGWEHDLGETGIDSNGHVGVIYDKQEPFLCSSTIEIASSWVDHLYDRTTASGPLGDVVAFIQTGDADVGGAAKRLNDGSPPEEPPATWNWDWNGDVFEEDPVVEIFLPATSSWLEISYSTQPGSTQGYAGGADNSGNNQPGPPDPVTGQPTSVSTTTPSATNANGSSNYAATVGPFASMILVQFNWTSTAYPASGANCKLTSDNYSKLICWCHSEVNDHPVPDGG